MRGNDSLEICHSGNYQIRYVNNSLVLVDCDNEHRIYNLQAAIQSGGFQLPANISNQFIIAADNVIMDLSGHVVQGGIVIAPNKSDVTIQNGLIGGKFASALSSGILAYSGCSNITIQDMQISNATVGINFESVANGLISNCDLSLNDTGVLLQSSSQIAIDNSRALQNRCAGFSLINSSTNCFTDCNALSTGEGNAQILNNTVFGFVSNDGYGNIFERCIANSTHALSTTDSSSIVAGFALRGIEGCSKIIECEAANATTSADGVTVPYGILLEATFDGLTAVTSVNPGDAQEHDTVYTVAWSLDGKYLAVGGRINYPTGDTLYLYYFDRVAQTLQQVDSINPGGGSQADRVQTIAWSPDGKYLAVGGRINYPTGDTLYLYYFDRVAQTLQQVDSINPGGGSQSDTVYTAAWSPDGKYLAVGGNITSADDLYLYYFDRVAQTLQQVDSINPGGGSQSDFVYTAAWSPDGKYLAVGGYINSCR